MNALRREAPQLNGLRHGLIILLAAVWLLPFVRGSEGSDSGLTAQMAQYPSKGLTLVALGVGLVIFAIFRKRLFSRSTRRLRPKRA